MYIALFLVAAPNYFLLGWGWGGKNIKSQKWEIFAIFVPVRGVCGGSASDLGRAKCPMHPHVTTDFFFFFFFTEKHQTQQELSLANCMHGNEMIIVDS